MESSGDCRPTLRRWLACGCCITVATVQAASTWELGLEAVPSHAQKAGCFTLSRYLPAHTHTHTHRRTHAQAHIRTHAHTQHTSKHAHARCESRLAFLFPRVPPVVRKGSGYGAQWQHPQHLPLPEACYTACSTEGALWQKKTSAQTLAAAAFKLTPATR